jgi:hypothetical protein
MIAGTLLLTVLLSLPGAPMGPGMGCLAPRPVAQAEEGKTPEEAQEEKPIEYPELSVLHQQQVKRMFTSFKNTNPKKRREFEKDMIKIGRGTIPLLVEKGTTKHEEEGECICNCLLVLFEEKDMALLKACYASKAARLRRVAVIKIASFQKDKYLEFLKKALKDEDEDIRLEAALGLVQIQDASGIGEIILNISKNRKNPSARLVKDLPKLKYKTYPSYFYPWLVDHEDPEVRMTAAEVIAEIGDPRLKPALGKALNDSHNLVQAAAVNALRKLVNGEEPRNYGNVFELIEEVNKWKKDLGIKH